MLQLLAICPSEPQKMTMVRATPGLATRRSLRATRASLSKTTLHLESLRLYRGEIDGECGREVESSVVAAHKLLNFERTRTWQPS
jgi:hypothetical protein